MPKKADGRGQRQLIPGLLHQNLTEIMSNIQTNNAEKSQLQASNKGKRDLRDYLNSAQVIEAVGKVSSGYLNPESVTAATFQLVNKVPLLLSCEIESVVASMKTLAQMGCMPDGIHGWLVPFRVSIKTGKKDERGRDIYEVRYLCTPIPSARGLSRMALNNGIRNIIYNTVRKGDAFEWAVRSGKFTCSHAPILWEDQKEILGFYCTWEDEHGNLFGVAMPKKEVDGIMNRSKSKDKDGNPTGPWKNDYEQMGLKTVVKRAAKQWPLPYAVQQAMQDADDQEFGGMRNVTPAKTGKNRIRLESDGDTPTAGKDAPGTGLPEPNAQPDTLFEMSEEKQPVPAYREDH